MGFVRERYNRPSCWTAAGRRQQNVREEPDLVFAGKCISAQTDGSDGFSGLPHDNGADAADTVFIFLHGTLGDAPGLFVFGIKSLPSAIAPKFF